VSTIPADTPQLAKIHWMAQELENLATQVYLSTAPQYDSDPDGVRATIHPITKAFATAFKQIAEAGGLLYQESSAKSGGDCGAGYCYDGMACLPCYAAADTTVLLFPRVKLPASAAPVRPEYGKGGPTKPPVKR
jgi:N-acetylmuramic acid 6-phosphate (MurNAc-6-P) etherase